MTEILPYQLGGTFCNSFINIPHLLNPPRFLHFEGINISFLNTHNWDALEVLCKVIQHIKNKRYHAKVKKRNE